MEKEVRPALFTEVDMETGKGVDVAEEARRMSLEPTISIDKWLAESCNVRVQNGKCTRSEAEKVLKIANWHLTGGDKTYLIENLRRKQGGNAAKPNAISMSDIPREKYDAVFGNKLPGYESLEKKIADLEARLSEKEKDNENKNKEDEAKGSEIVGVTMWTCPDCDKEMKLAAKNLHKAKWCPVKNEAKNKKEEAK